MRAVAGVLGVAISVWALLAAVTTAAPAQIRTPSIACSVADSNMVLDLYLPMAPDGSGGPARTGMQGTLEIHHFKVPKDRRRWSLDGRQPSLIWNHGNEMRLRLMLAPGENMVDLVIETATRPGAGAHMGNFRLDTAEGVRVTGRIECHVG